MQNGDWGEDGILGFRLTRWGSSALHPRLFKSAVSPLPPSTDNQRFAASRLPVSNGVDLSRSRSRQDFQPACLAGSKVLLGERFAPFRVVFPPDRRL